VDKVKKQSEDRSLLQKVSADDKFQQEENSSYEINKEYLLNQKIVRAVSNIYFDVLRQAKEY
jgi:hypothetical protein